MELFSILILMAAIGNLSLGAFILFKNLKNAINRSFGFFAIITGLWVFVNFLFEMTTEEFFLKLAYSLGVLVPVTGLIWIYLFGQPKLSNACKILLITLSSVAIFLACACFINNWIVETINSVIQTGPLFYLYAFYIFLIILLALIKISQILIRSQGIKKEQAKFILIGIGAFSFASLFVSIVLPFVFQDTSFSQLDSPSSIFFVALSAYAILKHHLFKIKVIATELLVGLITVILLTDLLSSKTLSATLLKTAILIAFIYLGWSLIKSVWREIHQKEKMEEMAIELRKVNTKLKKLDEAKSEFISIASHQLRTPLSAIIGYLSMVLEGTYGKISEKVQKPISNVFRASKQLNKLVNTLLNVSRIEAGKIKLEAKKISLQQVLEPIVEEFKILASEKGLYLKLSIPSSLPEINLDTEKINQVIMNLIDNSIKYTEKGGINIKVIERNQNSILIEIADTGLGM